jgi:mRNA interferase RelE/StbE
VIKDPSLIFSKQAVKTLKRLQPRIAKHLLNAMKGLPGKGNVKPIKGKGTPPLFRLRVGKYRIIFHKQEQQIKIIKIDTRGDVYKTF